MSFHVLRRISCPITCALVLFGVAGPASCPSAIGATITFPVAFSGPGQTIDFGVEASGEFTVAASGVLLEQPFVLDPNPQTQSVVLVPNPTTAVTNPYSLFTNFNGQPSQPELDFDDETWQLLDIRNMHVSILGDSQVPATINPLSFDVNLNDLTTLTVGMEVIGFGHDFFFWQTGPATISGNNIAIPGLARGDLDLQLFLTGMADPIFETEAGFLPTPVVFMGAVTTTILPGGSPRDVLVEIDGSAILPAVYEQTNFPLEFANPPLIEVDGSISYLLNATYSAEAHFETVLVDAHVPEPGTISLFAVGAALFVARAAVKRRRRFRS